MNSEAETAADESGWESICGISRGPARVAPGFALGTTPPAAQVHKQPAAGGPVVGIFGSLWLRRCGSLCSATKHAAII